MTSLTFSLELAQELYSSHDDFPVSFDDAWAWLEFSRKNNAKRSFEKAGFVEGLDFQVLLTKEQNSSGGRPTEVISLTCECFKQWGMMAGTAKGKEIRGYFIECERVAKAAIAQHTPQTYIEALKALVAAEEEKELLRIENAQLEEETERLSEVVDELFDYSSIIRIAKYNKCSEKLFSWRKLKNASTVKGLEVKKVPCPRFETKNLYHHDAWRYVYPDVKLPETTTLVIKPN